MTYYGNELTLSLVLLSTTGTPFATVNAPLVRARTVAVANDGLSAGANAASRALLVKNMLLTMIAVVYFLCSVPTEFYEATDIIISSGILVWEQGSASGVWK